MESGRVGTAINVRRNCSLCVDTTTWCSQRNVGEGRGTPAANLALSAGVMMAGASFEKVSRILRFMNVPHINERTFSRHNKAYIQPTIIKMWHLEQEALQAEFRGRELSLAGDARCDTPGHCAKYSSYSLMENTSSKVLDVQLVQVRNDKNKQFLVCSQILAYVSKTK